MADIQFNEPQYGAPRAGPQRSWLTGLVIKTGLAKDDHGAQKVLLIVFVLAVIGTVGVFAFGSGSSGGHPPAPFIDGTPR